MGKKAAHQNLANSQNNLGYMYFEGLGVTKDYSEAITWFRRAAEQGQARAQYSLGYIYENGKGVPKDPVSAYFWYDVAGDTASRNVIAKSMTSNQIKEAKHLVRDFKSKHRR